MTKKQRDQQEAFWELLHTETDYIKKIKVIIDVRISTNNNWKAKT